MDEELSTLLQEASQEGFDWSRLMRALQHRGYPGGKDGLKAIQARLKAFQTRMESETRSLLTAESKRLFAQHPKLESFSWRQYTPYWCDGEPCNFSTNMRYPSINGEEYYGIEDPELSKIYDDVVEMLKTFDDSYLMYQLFGDHKTVKVNREGIFVETYEHE